MEYIDIFFELEGFCLLRASSQGFYSVWLGFLQSNEWKWCESIYGIVFGDSLCSIEYEDIDFLEDPLEGQQIKSNPMNIRFRCLLDPCDSRHLGSHQLEEETMVIIKEVAKDFSKTCN